jgi:hypothetical protein
MPEMKESANIKEEEDLKELLSRVEKEQPLKAETIIDKILPTKFDTNLSPPTPSSAVYGVDTSLEERAAMLRGSKQDASDLE